MPLTNLGLVATATGNTASQTFVTLTADVPSSLPGQSVVLVGCVCFSGLLASSPGFVPSVAAMNFVLRDQGTYWCYVASADPFTVMQVDGIISDTTPGVSGDIDFWAFGNIVALPVLSNQFIGDEVVFTYNVPTVLSNLDVEIALFAFEGIEIETHTTSLVSRTATIDSDDIGHAHPPTATNDCIGGTNTISYTRSDEVAFAATQVYGIMEGASALTPAYAPYTPGVMTWDYTDLVSMSGTTTTNFTNGGNPPFTVPWEVQFGYLETTGSLETHTNSWACPGHDAFRFRKALHSGIEVWGMTLGDFGPDGCPIGIFTSDGDVGGGGGGAGTWAQEPTISSVRDRNQRLGTDEP